ncbi:ABC transporter permease [Microtetraspora malaysiensis]|uniref:ABC transporter permease n=1 Tax=Microtetraspora malaysiensis TaxID=161358 RepID=UPI003D9044EC
MTLNTEHAEPTAAPQGMAVTARTQRQLVTRRFFRHKGALFGLALFLFVFVLAFTSIGFGPLPGWWDKPWTGSGTLLDRGRPTLSVIPEFLGGSGIHLGEHPFGQDNLGKDYFALTMRGAQISIIVALAIGLVSTFVGTVIGALAGYFRGWIESALMRLTDVMITIPVLIIGAVVGQIAGNLGPYFLALMLGVITWTSVARLVRGQFLSLREKEFVEAAQAVGTSSRRIIFKHIMPNTLGVIIVSATLAVSSGILLETALSFIGFGVRPPDTSLGQLIQTYRSAMVTRPWLFWWPGIFIIAIALSVNFIGDGLRDAFDPRQNRVRN